MSSQPKKEVLGVTLPGDPQLVFWEVVLATAQPGELFFGAEEAETPTVPGVLEFHPD